jgi:hypothetical protein
VQVAVNNPDYNWLWGDGDWAAWTRFSGWVVAAHWDKYFKAGSWTSCDLQPLFLSCGLMLDMVRLMVLLQGSCCMALSITLLVLRFLASIRFSGVCRGAAVYCI